MLHATRTASQKRQDLRALLVPGAAHPFPGAFTPLSAQLIEEKCFPGVYLSGAVIAAELGLPDIGLTTLSEVAARGGQIARSTDLPCLIDADTGFGEPLNAARTVQLLEDAGLAGCHIEDQVNPKRCGHLDGKATVDRETAMRRIRAAADARRDPDFLVMARTDVRAAEGVDAAVDRLRALVDAGAEAVFPEALESLAEFEQVCTALDVPVLANMTEFGRTPLFTRAQLAEAGVAMAIYPVTLLRAAMGAAERVLETLRAEGSQASHVPEMLTRARLYELVDYEGYTRFDAAIAGAEPPTTPTPHTDTVVDPRSPS
ncbi:methylisocitrate lyase [Brachybacterium sp. YJGR34]|uniref:methylisocitrate lyase n=1 Tax=Brachybacterium sp. YJGR34 TaxID=2059911 RepID=UPI000E0C30AC|nr:methylisocitrate lyase [Brachybacterium sp. YJGR34]